MQPSENMLSMHSPPAGSTCCNAYNTGILVLRNRPATLELMDAWHHADKLTCSMVRCRSKDKEYLDKNYRIGDQVALEHLLIT